MCDILDHAMHSTAEQLLVFIVHCHDDEELRPARRVIMDLAERKTLILEVVGVACSSRVAHMCEFTLVAKGAHVKQLGRDSGVEDKVTVEKPVMKGWFIMGNQEKINRPLTLLS
jgi:hypothetical protein